MDQQVQVELSEANMQTEGSRGKEKAPSEVSSKRSLSPPSLQLLVLLQKLEPQQKLHVPRWRSQKDSLK